MFLLRRGFPCDEIRWVVPCTAIQIEAARLGGARPIEAPRQDSGQGQAEKRGVQRGAPGLEQACATAPRRPARSQKKWQVACSLRSFRATLEASRMTQCGSGARVSARAHAPLRAARTRRFVCDASQESVCPTP